MMKTRSSVFGSAALSIIFILPPGSELGFQEELTLQQKAIKADLILVGKVTDAETREEPKGMIYTYITVSIEENIKGNPGKDKIIIRVTGGEVDGIAAIWEGMPSFSKGERVLVFLLQDLRFSPDCFFLVRGNQGKYSIAPNNIVLSIGKPLPEFVDEIRRYISISSWFLFRCFAY